MTKKILIIIGLLVLVGVGYYLLSPLWRVVEADDTNPLEGLDLQNNNNNNNVEQEVQVTESNQNNGEENDLVVNDAMDTMNSEQKIEFNNAVREASKTEMVMDDVMPDGPRIISQNDFVASAHEVEGKAILIDTGEETILRFEDFETVNGPELHIYLATDLSDDDFIDLGIIKATKGNVNYDIDENVDKEKYNKVLVWCKPFGVLFSYADLS